MHRFILILMLLFGNLLSAQVISDSMHIKPNDTSTTVLPYVQQYQEDEEMNMFLMLLAIVGISVMLGIALFTALLCAMVLLAIGALTGAGILSASIGVGIYKKSLNAAVRTAVTLLFTIIGAAGGAGIAVLLIKLLDLSMSIRSGAFIGTGAGAIGGVIAAAALWWLIKKLWGKFRE